MTTTAAPRTLNDLLEADRADAWAHFDRLAGIYASQLRSLARAAVPKLHRAQWTRPVTAAGGPADWTLPDPDELINAAKAAGEMAGATRKVREQIAEASIGGTLAAYGIAFDLRNPIIDNVLTQMGQHITQIVNDQRGVIMQSLQDSWEKGLSIGDAAKAMVRDSVIDSKARGQMIARTELTGATSGGSLAAVRLINQASPPESTLTKIWIATNDDRTREAHSIASDEYGPGNGIPDGQPFVVDGEEMQHPGDPSGSAGNVINCRCTIGYEQSSGQVAAPAESMPAQAKPIPGPPDVTPQGLAQSLVADARAAEPDVTGALQRFVSQEGGSLEGLDFRFKTEESLARKLVAKAAAKKVYPFEYASQVSDVLRYTGVFSPGSYSTGVARTIAELRKAGYKIEDKFVSNYWQYGDDYNGINLDVSTKSGYRFELQFHTPESFALKNGELHKLYEQFRVATDPFERRELWDRMVSLSDAIPRPDGEAALLKIGTLTQHEAPIARGLDEVTLAAEGPPLPRESPAGAALGSYTGTGYEEMNTLLRYGTFRDVAADEIKAGRMGEYLQNELAKLREQIKLIEDSMVRARQDVIVYRGYKKSVLGHGDLYHLVGKTIEDPGYISTTASEEQAQNFAFTGAGGSGSFREPADQVIMEIVTPKGTPILDVGRRTIEGRHYGNPEKEFILPPGTRYRVTNVRRDGEGRWIVRAVIE